MSQGIPTSRELRHTRTITSSAYARPDGLWDIELELSDIKTYSVPMATGVLAPNQPLHHKKITFTLDRQLTIQDAQAESIANPYPGMCNTITPAYKQLIGLNLMKGFYPQAKALLGGDKGCTHLTEMCAVLPSAAIQAYAGDVIDTREGEMAGGVRQKPFQLDRCHALKSDGEAVKTFYPSWYVKAAT